MYSIFLFLHCKNVCESLLKLIDWKNVSDLSLFLSFIVFNNNIKIYKTQFYKHYLQCRSHYHALLTEQYTYAG